jgi:hypothetical protein
MNKQTTCLLTYTTEIVLDLTDLTEEELQQQFQEVIANKRKENRQKKGLEDLFACDVWKSVTVMVRSMGIDIDVFITHASRLVHCLHRTYSVLLRASNPRTLPCLWQCTGVSLRIRYFSLPDHFSALAVQFSL